MKREIDTIRTDRDMTHARRVSHTDFHGTVHPTLSLGSLCQTVLHRAGPAVARIAH